MIELDMYCDFGLIVSSVAYQCVCVTGKPASVCVLDFWVTDASLLVPSLYMVTVAVAVGDSVLLLGCPEMPMVGIVGGLVISAEGYCLKFTFNDQSPLLVIFL